MENKEIKELANNILKKTKGDMRKIAACLEIAKEDEKLFNALFFEIFKKDPYIFHKMYWDMVAMLDARNINEVIRHAFLVKNLDIITLLFCHAKLIKKNYELLAELASASTLKFNLVILCNYPNTGSKEVFKSILNLVLTNCKENPNITDFSYEDLEALYNISKSYQCDNEMYNNIFEVLCDKCDKKAYSQMFKMFSKKLTTSNIETAVDLFCKSKHLDILSEIATSPIIQGENLHRILTAFIEASNNNANFTNTTFNFEKLLRDKKVLQDEKALNLVWRAVIIQQNIDLFKYIVENISIPEKFVDDFVAKVCETRSKDDLRLTLLNRHELTEKNIDKLVKAICENAYVKELEDTTFSKKINSEQKKFCLDKFLQEMSGEQLRFVAQFLEGDDFLFFIKGMIDKGFIFEASRFLEFGNPSKEYIDLIAKPVAENGVYYHSYCLLTEDISFEIFKKCLENVKNSEYKSHVMDWLVDAAKNLKNQERRELVVSAMEEIEEQRKKEEEKKNKILAPSEMIEKYLEELE